MMTFVIDKTKGKKMSQRWRSIFCASLMLFTNSLHADDSMLTPQRRAMETGDWYTAEQQFKIKPTEVIGMDGRPLNGLVNRDFIIQRGTDLNIVSINPNDQTVELGFNNEGQSEAGLNQLPFSMKVHYKDLDPSLLSLVVYDDSVNDDEDLAEAEEMDALSEVSPALGDALDVARRGGRGRNRNGILRQRRSQSRSMRAGRALRTSGTRVQRVFGRNGMTMCLAEVRVNAKGICGQTMPVIGKAADGYNAYVNAGWRPVAYDPSNNSVCTACFWGGGRTDCSGGPCGHAALKVANNGTARDWIGAGFRNPPALPDRYGCSRAGRRGKRVCRVPYTAARCAVAPGH